MKKPQKTGKPKRPKKPGPRVSGGPVVVPVHPHHRHPKPRHHPKAAPVVKHAQPHKRRALPLGEGWPCCAAEALGASLRLAGWPVTGGDVLALHVAAGGSRDVGVPILAALEAAARVGLAGLRPRGYELVTEMSWLSGARNIITGHLPPLILGAELPGPHALTVDGPGVWSWGEWHPWGDFPGAVIEEAWLVDWEVR